MKKRSVIRRRSIVPLLLALLGFVAASSGQEAETQDEVLGVEHVVRMFVGGLSAEVLIERIGRAQVDFDLSEDMQEELAIAGIPASVIQAMVDRQNELDPAPAEPAPEPEPEPAAGLVIRLTLQDGGDDDKAGGTLDLRDTVSPETLKQLGVRDDQARISDVALYVGCLSATHVPDHWRSHSPLGRDFNSMSRHKLLAFTRGATSDEPAEGEQRKREGILRLELPETIELELDPHETHNLEVGLAVMIEDRFYRVVSSRVDDLLPSSVQGPLPVSVTPANSLNPAAVKISIGS